MELPRIDVEPTLDDSVRRAGGEILREILGPDPGFENADYVFREEGVVAELKCMERNPLDDPNFQNAISQLHDSWVAQGKVPPSNQPTLELNTRDLPRDCAIEFLGLFKRRLEYSYVKKAASQIKSTKANLDLPNARGLLILVNEGNWALPPAVALNLVHHILNGQYHNINHCIYLTLNIQATIPGVPEEVFLWADAFADQRDRIDPKFLQHLSSCLGSTLEAILGTDLQRHLMEGSTPEDVDRVQLTSYAGQPRHERDK